MQLLASLARGGHCIGNCTPTRDRGQSEVKRSRRNFEGGQAVKLGIGGSLRTVKVSPGDRWAWLMLDSRGSRPDFRCGQGVKHENLLGQDLDRGRGWKYRRLCSVPPCLAGHTPNLETTRLVHAARQDSITCEVLKCAVLPVATRGINEASLIFTRPRIIL